ncbi:MAG: hypothetical protein ACI9SF_000671 [Candidatus Nanohaloarchaea archaeon]|jgi:hypothetical protein
MKKLNTGFSQYSSMNEEKLDEKIEELVEKRVEQRMKEKKEEMKEEVKQELQTENSNSQDEISDNSVLSRRQFMKTAGLGIGALSLSSLTSAWSILQPSSQGTSDIDADQLDGNDFPSSTANHSDRSPYSRQKVGEVTTDTTSSTTRELTICQKAEEVGIGSSASSSNEVTFYYMEDGQNGLNSVTLTGGGSFHSFSGEPLVIRAVAGGGTSPVELKFVYTKEHSHSI